MQETKKKRKGYATQEAQNEANKRYYHASEENKQRKKYTNARSTAKRFIETLAKYEDILMLKELAEKKLKNFE
ncbi:hypothetical protein [Streptococcus suis]|uniref:hypothetical protein n=1 Tax=Streptococcus suis TaxID=1307 RepID=UPI003BA0C6F9